MSDGVRRTAGATDTHAVTVATDVATAIARDRLGLRVSGSLRARLAHLVGQQSAASGLAPSAWVATIADDSEALELVVGAVTIQESSWFRDPLHFDALRRHLGASGRGRLVWSAGCALGQEPYSLAITLEEAGLSGHRVLATDLDTGALAVAVEGRYRAAQLNGLDQRRRQRWMIPSDGGRWQVRPELRQRVTFRRHNLLLDPLPPEITSCDAVFCRNVLLYADPGAASAFVDRLAGALRPGAVVFVGGSEAMWRFSDRLEPTQLGGCYCYVVRAPGRPHPAARHPAAVQLPQPRPAPRPSPPPLDGAEPNRTPGTSEAEALLAAGVAALEAERPAEAVRLLRQSAYLDPDLAAAHFTLGVALESAGQGGAAHRAWRAALGALRRAPEHQTERSLHGHTAAGLAAAVRGRLAGGGSA